MYFGRVSEGFFFCSRFAERNNERGGCAEIFNRIYLVENMLCGKYDAFIFVVRF